MNIETAIISELQVRCLAYNLTRKFPVMSDDEGALATSHQWADMLGMSQYQGSQAYEMYRDFSRYKIGSSDSDIAADQAFDRQREGR